MSTSPWVDALLLLLVIGCVGALLQLWRVGNAHGNGPKPAGGNGNGFEPLRTSGAVGWYETMGRQAGLHPTVFRWTFWPAKLVLAALVPLLYLESDGLEPLGATVLLAGLIGFCLPDLWLFSLRQFRRRRIETTLSYFLDLLVAFLLAGLGLEEAFRRAGRYGLPPSHPLAEEATLVAQELEGGRDRSSAFRALADRTGVADLRRLASSLEMGVRVGTPIRSTLEAQAELLRVKRREWGLRRINRAMLAALLPVILCGFPVLLVLAFFPSGVQLFETLRAIGDMLR